MEHPAHWGEPRSLPVKWMALRGAPCSTCGVGDDAVLTQGSGIDLLRLQMSHRYFYYQCISLIHLVICKTTVKFSSGNFFFGGNFFPEKLSFLKWFNLQKICLMSCGCNLIVLEIL